MSNYFEIEQGMFRSFLDANFGYPTEVNGLPAPVNMDKTALHCFISHINADTNPVTLGDQGLDQSNGFLQVDIKYPMQKGSNAPLQAADEIASAYPSGRSIIYGGVTIRIMRTNLSPKMIVGGLIQYSLTIYYFAQTSRN